MRTVFQQELQEVQERLVAIATLVHRSITDAVQSFAKSDVALADQVIARDDQIDELTVTLDELAIDILARQQPVARDLRVVVSALRISASLERMGDMAEDIAQLTRYRFPGLVVPDAARDIFVQLGELDIQIAAKVVEVLQSQNTEIAEQIRSDDDRVDALHQQAFDLVLAADWHGSAEDTVDVTLASRYHERFADHAVKIANKMIYLITGDTVRARS